MIEVEVEDEAWTAALPAAEAIVRRAAEAALASAEPCDITVLLADDATVRDLVNFLAWIGEPHAASRKNTGIVVLLVLALLVFPLAYWLKKEYWKDVK